MTREEVEALLRDVPMLKCPTCTSRGLRCEELVPDFPAMAQAVREAVDERDRKVAATLTREINNANRLLAERDALRVEVAQLQALLRTAHPDTHGHEDWLHCAVCAALAHQVAPAEG